MVLLYTSWKLYIGLGNFIKIACNTHRESNKNIKHTRKTISTKKNFNNNNTSDEQYRTHRLTHACIIYTLYIVQRTCLLVSRRRSCEFFVTKLAQQLRMNKIKQAQISISNEINEQNAHSGNTVGPRKLELISCERIQFFHTKDSENWNASEAGS